MAIINDMHNVIISRDFHSRRSLHIAHINPPLILITGAQNTLNSNRCTQLLREVRSWSLLEDAPWPIIPILRKRHVLNIRTPIRCMMFCDFRLFMRIVLPKATLQPLPPHLPVPISELYYAILISLIHPPINPRLHLSPASRTSYVDRRDDLLNL